MTNDSLIDELIRRGYLKTPLAIDAFRKIDRKDFVPKDLESEAYENYPLPIGHGQTISQPLTVVFMLELLQPGVGEKILDIGCGSGWQTCLLAYIASRPRINADGELIYADNKSASISQNQHKSALIIGIERIQELKEMAEKNIRKYNFVEKGIVKIILGDGSKGAPPDMRHPMGFDKIIAAATAEKIPEEWKEQLKIGGRIVAPVGQSIWKLDKIGEKEFRQEEYSGFSFVPLIKD